MLKSYDLNSRRSEKELEDLERQAKSELPPPCAPCKAIVFIHGIFSDHEAAFNDMRLAVDGDERFTDWEVCWFDYDFNDHIIHNAHRLTNRLYENFKDGDEVQLVCHSMGGLVARFAILSQPMPYVKRAFLIGTPNFGAFRASSLGLLAQLALVGSRRVHAVFSRKSGLLDLTKVTELLRQFRESEQGNFCNADHVEYVTIPGLYFSRDTTTWGMTVERWKLLFGGIAFGSALVSGIPWVAIGMERPHDGIVEASSNCMIKTPEDRRLADCEKAAWIGKPDGTYAHAEHRACATLNHVMIQHDSNVIAITKEMILCPNVRAWWVANEAKYRHEVEIAF
jgi:pimeloyl-ACP methyl ester carboxylesterase